MKIGETCVSPSPDGHQQAKRGAPINNDRSFDRKTLLITACAGAMERVEFSVIAQRRRGESLNTEIMFRPCCVGPPIACDLPGRFSLDQRLCE